MKKLVLVLILVICIVLSMAICTGIVFGMPTIANDADVVFRNVLDQLLAEEGYYSTKINAQKQIVYDMNLAEFGYVYDFIVEEKDCYAIVINTDGIYEASEIYFDSLNPYRDIDGLPIYVTNMTYLYWVGDRFYAVGHDDILPENIIQDLSEIAYYCGSGEMTSSSEKINFVTRSENTHDMAKRNPSNVEVPGLTNACVPIAGANIVQYFDRDYQNLIPNFTPGVSLGQHYLYKEKTEEMNTVTRQLYSDMGTNTTGIGSSVAQFKSGMIKYAKRYGYSATFVSCMNGNSLNYDKVKAQITNGNPVVIFLRTMSIATFTVGENQETINYLNSSNAHSLIGFGYKEVTYALSNNTTRQDKYVSVSTGLTQRSRGYLKLANGIICDDSFSVKIF